ncbi:hypothetical protein K1719_042088 [Acacia pycnantha]|nr:hypothetical protein K1719_042088 [Acacia pycnantha]
MSTKAIMPGLEACSAEFSPYKFLKGQKITVFCGTATEEAALTKTLTELGATRGLDWGAGGGPNLIIDDEGIVLPFICACVEAEKNYAQKGGLPVSSDFEVATQFFLSIVGEENFLSFISEGLETDPKRYHNLREGLLGVSVGTFNDWMQPMPKEAFRSLSFPVLGFSDLLTKSKVTITYNLQFRFRASSMVDGIKRGTNMTISGKTALVCGYNDDASNGCAMALKKGGANVVVAEADPHLATQACLRGFLVINKAPDNVVSEADILVVKFNMDNIDGFSNVKNMKNNAVIYNTGSSTDVALFEPYFPDMKQIILDSHTEKWVSSDGNKCVYVVSNPPGYPNLVSSWSATSHVVAMLEFMGQKKTGKYVGKVYDFPKHLDEKVFDLHLGKKETQGQVCQLYDIYCSIPTKMTISRKTTLVCGYDDDASQGCAMALKQGGANVVVAEADPNLATQARLRDFSVINKAHDNVVSEADILMVNFNMDNINVLRNVKNMKNNAVIYNRGPILDHNSNTHVALFGPYFSGMEQIILDDHTAIWVSPDTNKCVILVRSLVYHDLTSSVSATSHVVAMLEFVSQKETGKYGGKVYDFPEHLAEKVTDLHLGELKAALAKRETEG